MPDSTFGDVADAYEAMIDWPRRLANEQGLFRRVFEKCNAKSVLDAACGTGHHAAMFRDWSLDVEAADASSEMIDRCRQRWGENDRLRWVQRRFEQPSNRLFDVVLCTGNSLALLDHIEDIKRAVNTLLASVRSPGGALVLHVLNLWAMNDGELKWQKCIRANLPQLGDAMVIKGVQRIGASGRVHLLSSNLQNPVLHSLCSPFLAVEPDDLESACLSGGATRVEILGGYQNQPYDRSTSVDLLAVAWT